MRGLFSVQRHAAPVPFSVPARGRFQCAIVCLALCAACGAEARAQAAAELVNRYNRELFADNWQGSEKGLHLDAPLKVLKAPWPEYPLAVRRRHIQGDVLLWVRVREDGTTRPEGVRYAAHEALIPLALKAVKQFVFAPPRRGGKPVSVSFVLPVSFALQPRQK